ncbi:hypothetical protein [Methylococcus geothermalis]|uniref:Uncharacterized protein n=1 Tax=Methylococcus geothermalis TaxID=2681310 RepID=A0A858QAA6_9GAMM|nr:hypothetical protein [Methylococcus geothermalis]QJD30827.1 hypothetical protein GNH96_13200 [Methylococcus geothermalis]
MTQFTFLAQEWPAVFEATSKAAGAVHADPCRRLLYQDNARRKLKQ